MIYLLIIFCLLLIAYIYLSAPSLRSVDLNKFTDVDYAHRGFHDNKSDAPENSLKAIKLAVENNYGIEFDIRLSKDDKIVVFHDDFLTRMCNIDEEIRKINFSDLNEIKLLNSEETIPLFSDVLNEVAGKVPLIVELKCTNEDVEVLASKATDLLEKYDGPFMVESFNPMAMAWFKHNKPEYIRGQLSSGNFKGLKGLWKRVSMIHLLFNFLSRPDFIAYEHTYRNNLSLKIQKSIWGKLMVAYTIKSQKEYNENDCFFDLLIFEGFKPN